MGRLGDDIYRLRKEMAHWQDNRDALVEKLKVNRQCIQHDVAEIQANFKREHQTQASHMRKRLHDYRRRIKVEVEEMRKSNARWREHMPDLGGDWRHMRRQIQDRLAETAHQGASERAAYVAGIRQHVSEIHSTFTQFRKTVTQELDDLRRAWHGDVIQENSTSPEDIPVVTLDDTLLETLETMNSGPEAAASEGEAVLPSGGKAVFPLAGETEPDTMAAGAVDDLTMIAGIGPERQKKLNAADIFTFENLSQHTAETLQTKLGKSVKIDEIRHWIDQAKELTRIG